MGRRGLCPGRRLRRRARRRGARPARPAAGRAILDVGCGDGTLTGKIVERGATVRRHRQFARDDRGGAGARASTRVLLDAADMKFDAEFDAAFSNATLHWVLDKEQAARAIFRALKPGGRFAGEMGGEGNLAKLREALDEELIIRGYVAAGRSQQLVSRRPTNSPPSMRRRLQRDRRPADRAADPARAWRRRLGHDLPQGLARPRRRARGRARRDRRRRRRPRRLQRRRLCPPPLHHEEARLMRYLPLTDADRSEMLQVIGAGSIDELFRDVPEEARLNGPIDGLPMHASRNGGRAAHDGACRARTWSRATCPSSSAAAPIATTSRRASIISSSAASS